MVKIWHRCGINICICILAVNILNLSFIIQIIATISRYDKRDKIDLKWLSKAANK